jgi:translation initiation factor 5B
MSDQVRSPICAVMGHVDHGKSSILDFIRNSSIVSREAGAITQAIGASIVPITTITDLCKKTIPNFKSESFSLPGVLFIDTPGHAAFTNLRKRGGNLADIAILVVDINEGLMPQTIEAIKILKEYKTPFIIAANKVDLIQGYRSDSSQSVLVNISKDQQLSTTVETKLYELVGKLYQEGELESERYDRVKDFTKQIAIVPTSALKGDGIAELLMTVAGLAQKFLEGNLHFDLEAPAKGTILEVKEEKGIGTALDIIIYDGNIKIGDTVIFGTMDEPGEGKIRGLFEPMPHSDTMDKKSKYKPVKQVFAATGVRASGPGMDNAVAGMPIRVVGKNSIQDIKDQIRNEVEEVIVENDEEGIVVKADSLGSLEALVRMLREEGFAVRKASVGEISRKDIADAETSHEKDRLNSCILGFNLKDFESTENVKIFTSKIIYSLIDNFKAWRIEELKKIEMEKLADINKPVKIEYLQNHTFRQNNPAIIGVEIIAGSLKSGSGLINKEGKQIGFVRQIQKDNKSVTIAEKSDQVAISVEGPTAGRQIHEGETYYSDINETEFIKFKKVKEFLEEHEKQVLKEIAEIKRENNPVWGV